MYTVVGKNPLEEMEPLMDNKRVWNAVLGCNPKKEWVHSFPRQTIQYHGNSSVSSSGFYCLGLQSHCEWWLQPQKIKRCLLLGRKAMTSLDSILKSTDITLPTKVHLVKAMVFAVVMYGCESWNIKKAEHWRTDAFELWYWRTLLRVPWSARRWKQSILKEINPE